MILVSMTMRLGSGPVGSVRSTTLPAIEIVVVFVVQNAGFAAGVRHVRFYRLEIEHLADERIQRRVNVTDLRSKAGNLGLVLFHPLEEERRERHLRFRCRVRHMECLTNSHCSWFPK